MAELVAALSLGIDLGFGQPMEHVLRQCLIALRLAERVGLDEEERATVYYTALLVNVGCHTDAHEQAKWFGDDFALKSTKYDYEMRSLGGAAATMKLLGSGNPPLHRFRIGLEFAVSGHRDLDGMIEHHANMARALGEQLGLPEAVLEGLGAAYEQWDGHGWPGELRGESVPLASRLAGLSEFIEVAHRVRGVEGAKEMAGLTPREVEVLRLVARGFSNKEIAKQLVISPKTVSNHVEHIYAKIDISSRAAAGFFAMQHGLLPDEELLTASPAAV